MKALITPIFADIIYKINLQEFAKYNADLEKTAMKFYKESKNKTVDLWSCNTFSTLHENNLNQDPIFKDILIKIVEQVSLFANEFSAAYNAIECTNSWVNVAKPGAFQEIHIHPNTHFSSVYYVKVPKGAGQLIFQSHSSNSDMFDFKVVETRLSNCKRYVITPQECDLIIFRSNLQHMVNYNNSKQNRISISSNFVLRNC